MATAEDLLRKAAERKKKVVFHPQKHRAWDYSTQVESIKSTQPTNLPENKISEIISLPSQQGNNSSKTNSEQISEQIWEQNRNKIGTDLGTIRNVNRYNSEQISEQSRDGYGNEIRNQDNQIKSVSQIKPIINFQNKIIPSGDKKSESYVLDSLRKTTGCQKKVMEQLTAHVKEMKEMVTVVNITVFTLSKRTGINVDVIRTSIKRLQNKFILLKSPGARGRNGFTQVVMPDFVLKECLNLFNCAPQSIDKYENEYRNETRNNSVYSSIYNINNTTNEKNKNLPEEWLAIDISPLQHIHFSTTQLNQLVDKNIPETVQESINYFAYDLEINPDKYQNPLNVLIGVLRKGNSWAAPKGYESPKDKALREYAEKIKSTNERREKMIEDCVAFEFNEWKENLSEDVILSIVPEHTRKFPGSSVKHPSWVAALRIHFKEKVLIPRLKQEGAY